MPFEQCWFSFYVCVCLPKNHTTASDDLKSLPPKQTHYVEYNDACIIIIFCFSSSRESMEKKLVSVRYAALSVWIFVAALESRGKNLANVNRSFSSYVLFAYARIFHYHYYDYDYLYRECECECVFVLVWAGRLFRPKSMFINGIWSGWCAEDTTTTTWYGI